MWRDSNAAAANMLAQQVMPIVRESIPEASLRIVGKDPTPQVQALNDLDNVSVVGAVESIEAEYLRAAVVLAPTLVDAGVLLKALRGLACGAPLIINAAAAIPLEVIDGEHCLVRDSPKEIAAAMIQLATDTRRASKLGRAGLLHVRENFSWESYGQKMTEGIER
jgi:glycosyltransferase involved in cell wall biosynthesis